MNKNELKNKLQKLGIEKNMKILLHVSLSKIGYLDNGPETLIESIKELISPYGIGIVNISSVPKYPKFI